VKTSDGNGPVSVWSRLKSAWTAPFDDVTSWLSAFSLDARRQASVPCRTLQDRPPIVTATLISAVAESGHQDPQQETQFVLDIALVNCFLYLGPQCFAEPPSRAVERRAKRLARTRTRLIAWRAVRRQKRTKLLKGVFLTALGVVAPEPL
jgi:hypothetical protein